MGIDTGVASSSGQVLVLTVRDMEVSLGVPVFLSETEINDIDLVSTLADTHQEVVRLDITVNERFGMDVLDTRDELVSE